MIGRPDSRRLRLTTLVLVGLGFLPRGAVAQEREARASHGDTVWVLLNHVKPDQRANFERYVLEILFPALQKLGQADPARMRQHRQTRVLVPTRANADSTYTYVYMMDPVVGGMSYGYRDILGRVYSEEEVARYLRMVDEALARPQERYVVVQHR